MQPLIGSCVRTPLLLPKSDLGDPKFTVAHKPFCDFAAPIFGMLSVPNQLKDGERFPGAILLGGSEGGINCALAEYLASRGLVTLSVAYLSNQNAMHVPPGVDYTTDSKWKTLAQNASMIDLTWFQEAVSFLKNQPNVCADKIIGIGFSYGAVLSLALASQYPEMFSAVAAWTPNVFVSRGVLRVARSTGTLEREKKLLSETFLSINGECYPRGDYTIPATQADLYRARIPVEKIDVPVFAVSGGEDRTWYRPVPSSSIPNNINAEEIQNLIPHREGNYFRNYPSNGHCFLPEEVVIAECTSYGRTDQKWYEAALQYSGGSNIDTIKRDSADAWSQFWRFAQRMVFC